jgi:hypothetical protein
MEYVAIAAATMKAVGAIRQGNAQAAAYESQAQANDYNAQVAQQNAATASAQGNANEEAQRRQARIALGQQRASIAEAGIGTGGSASDLYEQSVSNSELDALNIRYQSQLQSTGYLNQAGLETWQAGQNRRNSSAARVSGYINAGAQALGGYGNYLQGQAAIKTASKGAGK